MITLYNTLPQTVTCTPGTKSLSLQYMFVDSENKEVLNG